MKKGQQPRRLLAEDITRGVPYLVHPRPNIHYDKIVGIF